MPNTNTLRYKLLVSPPTAVSPTPPLVFGTNSVPETVAGEAYEEQLEASGGTPPYTFTVISGSLPPGVTLMPNGQLSGTPTQSGAFIFTVQVTDSTGIVVTGSPSPSPAQSPAQSPVSQSPVYTGLYPPVA